MLCSQQIQFKCTCIQTVYIDILYLQICNNHIIHYIYIYMYTYILIQYYRCENDYAAVEFLCNWIQNNTDYIHCSRSPCCLPMLQCKRRLSDDHLTRINSSLIDKPFSGHCLLGHDDRIDNTIIQIITFAIHVNAINLNNEFSPLKSTTIFVSHARLQNKQINNIHR